MKLAFVNEAPSSNSNFGHGFMATLFEHIFVPIATLMGFNPSFMFDNTDETDLFRTFAIAPFFREFPESIYAEPLKAWRNNGRVTLKDCRCNLTILHHAIAACTLSDSFMIRGYMPVIGKNLQVIVYSPAGEDSRTSEYTKLAKLDTNGHEYVKPVEVIPDNVFRIAKWFNFGRRHDDHVAQEA